MQRMMIFRKLLAVLYNKVKQGDFELTSKQNLYQFYLQAALKLSVLKKQMNRYGGDIKDLRITTE